MNEYDKLRLKIEMYRKNKNGDMFDDFYNSDLDFILQCLDVAEYYRKDSIHKCDKYENCKNRPNDCEEECATFDDDLFDFNGGLE